MSFEIQFVTKTVYEDATTIKALLSNTHKKRKIQHKKGGGGANATTGHLVITVSPALVHITLYEIVFKTSHSHIKTRTNGIHARNRCRQHENANGKYEIH